MNILYGFFPTFFLSLFLGDLLGREPDTYDDPLVPYCSAKQGIFSAIDFKGNVYSCSSTKAKSLGTIYPQIKINNNLIKEWNSKDFIVKEFLKNECIDCKYFFLCGERLCPFVPINNFDSDKKYCLDIYEGIKCFIDYCAKNVWNEI